jgi:hypothetical protein
MKILYPTFVQKIKNNCSKRNYKFSKYKNIKN